MPAERLDVTGCYGFNSSRPEETLVQVLPDPEVAARRVAPVPAAIDGDTVSLHLRKIAQQRRSECDEVRCDHPIMRYQPEPELAAGERTIDTYGSYVPVIVFDPARGGFT